MSKSGLLALAAGFSCAEEVKYTRLTIANGITKSGNRRVIRDIVPPIGKCLRGQLRLAGVYSGQESRARTAWACDLSSNGSDGNNGAPVARGKIAERSERGTRRALGKSSGDTARRRCRRTIREAHARIAACSA